MRILFVLLLTCLSAFAVDPTWNFQDFTGQPLKVQSVTVTPLYRWTVNGNIIVNGDPKTYGTNLFSGSSLTVSNLLTPYAYAVSMFTKYQTTTITNYFGTNALGGVNASAFLAVPTNLVNPNAVAYSQSAADARFALIGSTGTATNLDKNATNQVQAIVQNMQGLPAANLAGQVPAVSLVSFTSNSNNYNGTFSGNAGSLSNLMASQLVGAVSSSLNLAPGYGSLSPSVAAQLQNFNNASQNYIGTLTGTVTGSVTGNVTGAATTATNANTATNVVPGVTLTNATVVGGMWGNFIQTPGEIIIIGDSQSVTKSNTFAINTGNAGSGSNSFVASFPAAAIAWPFYFATNYFFIPPVINNALSYPGIGLTDITVNQAGTPYPNFKSPDLEIPYENQYPPYTYINGCGPAATGLQTWAIFHIGVNDPNRGTIANTPLAAITNYQFLINLCYAHGIKPVATTIPIPPSIGTTISVNGFGVTNYVWLTNFNALVMSTLTNCARVDVDLACRGSFYQVTGTTISSPNPTNLMSDSLHYTDAGAKFIAQVIYNNLHTNAFLAPLPTYSPPNWIFYNGVFSAANRFQSFTNVITDASCQVPGMTVSNLQAYSTYHIEMGGYIASSAGAGTKWMLTNSAPLLQSRINQLTSFNTGSVVMDNLSYNTGAGGIGFGTAPTAFTMTGLEDQGSTTSWQIFVSGDFTVGGTNMTLQVLVGVHTTGSGLNSTINGGAMSLQVRQIR